MTAQAIAKPGICWPEVVLADIAEKVKVADKVSYAGKDCGNGFADAGPHVVDAGQRSSVVSFKVPQKRNDMVGMFTW